MLLSQTFSQNKILACFIPSRNKTVIRAVLALSKINCIIILPRFSLVSKLCLVRIRFLAWLLESDMHWIVL